MKSWWAGRTKRERVILGAGGIFVSALVLAQATLAPLLAWRVDAQAGARAAEDGYRMVAQAGASPGPAISPSAAPVRNVINETAAALQIDLTFVNVRPDGAVDLQAGPTPPERLFQFLSKLEREHGVKVQTADIARASDDPDQVMVQAALAR